MLSIKSILLLLLLHTIGDLVLQPLYISTKKSKNFNLLLSHSVMYSLPFLLIFKPHVLILLFLAHTLQDKTSSIITWWIYNKYKNNLNNKKLNYICYVVCLDQILHFALLVLLTLIN